MKDVPLCYLCKPRRIFNDRGDFELHLEVEHDVSREDLLLQAQVLAA